MSTAEFQLKDFNPRAVSCIVIGRVPTDTSLPGDSGRNVLWFVDEAGHQPPPPCFKGGIVTMQLVDRSEAEQMEQAIHSFITKFPKTLPSLFVTRSIPPALLPQFTAAINLVISGLAANHSARTTRQLDAVAWQQNIFANLRGYLTRRMPASWKGCLTGWPAFICGAGPSFDHSSPSLARMAERGVIFAGDSSLRRLAQLGVQADFAVSVDVAKQPVQCLPENGAPRRLLLTAVSPPSWSDALPFDRQFYLSGNQLPLDWLAGHGLARTEVAVAENCGATALELARFMGCAPIYLFGMDLALKSDDALLRNHESADPASYENADFDPARRFPLVPGNFAEKVQTHVIVDLNALARRLAAWPAGLVSVVTNGGARIGNTTVLTPEQFEVPVPATNKRERFALLAASSPPPDETVRVIAAKLEQLGRQLERWSPAWRKTLNIGQANALAAELRKLFAAPEDNRIIGAYLMKLVPHLLPPIATERPFWVNTIDELETLGHHAIKSAAEIRRIPLTRSV